MKCASVYFSFFSPLSSDVNNTTIDRQLEDSNVVSGLLDIVCIFWVCRSAELSQTENTEYRTLLEKKSIRILTGLFKYYRVSQ